MKRVHWQISNGTVVLPDEIRAPAGLVIAGNTIERITAPGLEESNVVTLNLHGLAVLPSLINGHDSLIATYDPVKGPSWPYLNWLAFDNDVKASRIFKERLLLDIESLYLLGAYKNLLGGSGYVVDHIPHFVRKPFENNLPVSMLPDFGIAHSHCSYTLGWGNGAAAEYARAEKEGIAFITHIAEGFDRESRESLQRLYDEGGLGKNTVLVHGLSLSDSDLDRIAAIGASVVWCPTANRFIYNAAAPIKKMIDRGINIVLGTDSAMSGSTGMLAELRFADALYRELTGETLDRETLFRMATVNGAKAFHLSDRGVIAESHRADFLVLNNSPGKNPYAALIEARTEDLFLLVHNGLPLLGDLSAAPVFEALSVPVERMKIGESEKIIVAGLTDLLESISFNVGYTKRFPFLNVDPVTGQKEEHSAIETGK